MSHRFRLAFFVKDTLLRVSLFITCYNDALFPDTGKAAVRVLERLGHEVEFLSDQTCCGQMHWNTGYLREAVPIVRHFARVFRDAETVVVPSSSCVAMMRDHYLKAAEMADDAALAEEVKALLPRVFEFSEFLVRRLGVEDVGARFTHKVAYHPSCHSERSLHLGDIPLRLLRRVRGLDLAPLGNSQECCGFGGTFAIKNADVSSAMLADKVRHVLNSGAEVLTAVDNSCLMHIYGSLHRQRTFVRVAHLAEILAAGDGDRSYEEQGDERHMVSTGTAVRVWGEKR
uniref:Putative iron-sulfur heterodisulfide reductase n=1 Tax=mine drainage metagenome TaxID=410659 RepID=E6Q075_9ZZZZ